MWYLWLDICLAANLQLIRSLSSGIKIRVCLSSRACTGMVGVAVVSLQDSSRLLLLLAPRRQGQCPHCRGQTSSSLSLHWDDSHSLPGQIQMLISLIFRCAFDRTVEQRAKPSLCALQLVWALEPCAGHPTRIKSIVSPSLSSRARFCFCFKSC